LGKTQARAKGNMKQYNAMVKITWSNFGIEARNKKEAIKVLKETYQEQYGIDLTDKEIVEVVKENK
jgi:cytidylate kinase